MTSGFVDPRSCDLSTTDTASAASVVCLSTLCVLLMGAVLAFGAVDIWATSVLEITSILLLAAWAVCQGKSIWQRLRWNPLYPPVLVFGVVVGAQIALDVTVYRYATLLGGVRYLALCGLLLLTVQVTGNERSSKIFLLTLGFFGSALATFAICQNLSAPGKLYWVQTPLGGASVFGPYVNHDHYAGLMELLTPLPLVLSLSRLLPGGQRILAAFAAVLMAGSIVLSGSRSGTFSLVVELAFLFWIASQARRRTGLRFDLLLLVFCLLAFVAWAGSGSLWHHFGDLQDATRPAILKDGLRMFLLKPLLGWGLGTFPTAYPAFRSFFTDLFVNAAHNDYLQALVETGAVGFACVVWFIVVLYRQAFKQITNWTHNWDSALRVAALTGCTGILVHSAFDFNLQIPANAALFFVLCAISTNFLVLSRKPVRSRSVISFRMQDSLDLSQVGKQNISRRRGTLGNKESMQGC